MKDTLNTLLSRQNIEFDEINKETVLNACMNTHMEYFISAEGNSCSTN